MAAPVQNVPVRVAVFRNRGKKRLFVGLPHGSKLRVEDFDVRIDSEGFFPDSNFAEVMFVVDPGINKNSVYLTPKEIGPFPASIREGTYVLTVDPTTHAFAVSERPMTIEPPQPMPPPQAAELCSMMFPSRSAKDDLPCTAPPQGGG